MLETGEASRGRFCDPHKQQFAFKATFPTRPQRPTCSRCGSSSQQSRRGSMTASWLSGGAATPASPSRRRTPAGAGGKSRCTSIN